MKRLTSILIIFTIILCGAVFAQNSTIPYLRSIACSDSGLYVAVGNNGLIITSHDGVSWSKISQVTSEKINGVIWAMGKFVAVGDKGGILTSSDGEQWSKLDLSLENIDLFSVASSGSEIIATGSDGTVLVSKDTVSWEQRRMATAERICRVRWINDRYIAVGGAMLILTSKDGITWDEVKAEPSSTIMFTDVAWDGDKYVVVGDHLNVWISKDGHSWNKEEAIVNKEGMDYTVCMYSVVWAENKFVAVGQRGNVLSSTDGVDWNKEGNVTRRVLKDIVYSNNKYVVIGDNGIILTSQDAVKWNNKNDISTQSNNINLDLGEEKLINIKLNRPYGETEDISEEVVFEVIDGEDVLSVGKDGKIKALDMGQAIVRANYDLKTIEISVSVDNDANIQKDKGYQQEENSDKGNSTRLSDLMLIAGAIIVVVALTLRISKK